MNDYDLIVIGRDYTATPFETAVRDVDVVLDPMGGTTESWSVRRPDGLLVTILRQPAEWTAGAAAGGSFFIVEPRRTQRVMPDGLAHGSHSGHHIAASAVSIN